MLQSYSVPGETFFEGAGQTLGIAHYFGLLKRRALYIIVPFCLVLLVGSFITVIQRPIYEAAGKILVESQEIPTDLVRPTVTAGANERIQVIQQRIMTRDNLLALVKKYGMFVRERQWMSDTQILDLMRERTKFQLVEIDSSSGGATIAFTVSFEYENPEATLRVTNDFLTLILDEDARNRTTRATETTNFLTRESQRAQAELTAVEAQIFEERARPRDAAADALDPAKVQASDLARLKEELAQKSATYSEEYPAVKALKKKVAAMERLVAQAPSPAVAQANSNLFELERQRLALETNLEDVNKKLEAARLGEKLERDQESERLQVIEQPVLPQKPIKPNRTKLFGLSLALAMAAAAGTVFAAETLDSSIRHSHELIGAASGRLIVSIPVIETIAEVRRRKSRIIWVVAFFAIMFAAVLAGVLFFGPNIDSSWFNEFSIYRLRSLFK